MLLDLKTLSLMVVITSILYAITIAFFALQANQYKGIALYMWGAVCAAIGFLSTTFYARFPELLTFRFGASAFLTLSCYSYFLGIARFLDFTFNSRWLCYFLVFGLSAIAYFNFFTPYRNMGGIIVTIYCIIFYSISCYFLWLHRHKNFASSIYFMLVSIILIILVLIARFYYMIAYHAESFPNEPVNNGFLMAIFISGYLRNVGFIMMVSHRLYQDLREAAMQDFLTKVHNRRSTQQILNQQFYQFQRYKNPFSLIMLDIDYFKKVNDTYGHEVGDKVLQGIANILKNHLRKTDILGRWGGEEFLCVLPNITIVEAAVVAEKLRIEIAKQEISGIACTISLGVKMIDNNDHNIDDAVKRVDDVLYQAKAQGRNRVCIFSETAEN